VSSSSPENETSRPSMTVDGPAGVEIQIIDGRYQLLARGTERLKMTLPQGVYMVKWLVPGRPQEKVVRLFPFGEPLHVPFPELSPPPAIASANAALGRDRTQPSQDQYDSDIVVIERTDHEADQEGASSKISRGLRLFNSDEVAMRSDSGAIDASREESVGIGGSMLRTYHVPSGNYRLRYDASSGLTLDQTVVAIAQRRTFVLLRQETGETLVAVGERYERRFYSGVSPGRTIVVTSTRSGPLAVPLDAVRMAEALLRALNRGGDPLDAHMLARLGDPDTDPLLCLYAATLILSQLERGRSPALDDPYPEQLPDADPSSVQQFEARWRGHAKRLIDGVTPDDCAPDLFALRWQLEGDASGTLTAPPMLVSAWEFAARHSARAVESVPDTPSFRGAARGRVGAGAWLAWRTGSAKEAVIEEAAAADMPDVGGAFDQLSSTLTRVTGIEDRVDTTLLDSLSPASRGVVNAARNLNIASGTGLDPESLARFAGALLTPNALLREKLQTASRELEGVATQAPATGGVFESLSGPWDPPALRLPVLQFDDPQKGRFGGQAEAGGFLLSASFSSTGGQNWVWINLVVTAKPGVVLDNDAIAEFFLHDTFRPPRLSLKFANRVAALRLRAFGGFTVGVWIPSQQVQLELDLAELSDAPRVIKEW
jgi:hypothetical protein